MTGAVCSAPLGASGEIPPLAGGIFLTSGERYADVGTILLTSNQPHRQARLSFLGKLDLNCNILAVHCVTLLLKMKEGAGWCVGLDAAAFGSAQL